ncbi:Cna B-type domain-containing protein, partial [Bifidobacterium moraviense]|uniref:Cna B-type domain-containing protein n=1 Tax=Bifidobacterium moraviense TaxID=2675323 RepID=UPI00145F9010
MTTTNMDNESSTEDVADLAAAQTKVNDLITNNQLDASNALIAVDTGTQVYHKAVPADIQKTITNEKSLQPVYIQPKVTKELTGDGTSAEGKTFTFKLSGEGVNQTKTVTLTKNGEDEDAVSADAVFDALQYDASNMKDAGGNPVDSKTFTYTITEESGSDKDVSYNTENASYKMTVVVSKADKASDGYKAKVTVSKLVGGQAPVTVFTDEFTSAGTNESHTDADGNTTYTPKPGQVSATSFKFVNELKKPETTKVSVTKQWKNDQESDRPASVNVQLQRTTAKAPIPADATWDPVDAAVDLTSKDGWAHTWENLPKADADGNEYTYRVVETSVPNGYTSETGTPVKDADGNWTVTITNTKKPEDVKTSVKVTKVWDDNQSANRPQSVQVQLRRTTAADPDAAGTQWDSVEAPVTLSADNQWMYTWGNLDIKDAHGNKYSYSVSEVAVNGYDSKVEVSKPTKDGDPWTVTVTNTKHEEQPSKESFSFTKVDADDKSQGLEGAKFELTGKDKDGNVVERTEESGKGGTVSFSDLPAGTYTVTETKAPSGYDLPDPAPSFTVKLEQGKDPVFSTDDKAGLVGCGKWASGEDATKAGTCTSSLTVTNTKPKVSVSASKTWVDDGSHPSSLEVTLQRRVGDGAWQDVETRTLNADNDWKTEWTGLDKYDASGNAYEYRVIEAATPGYTQAVTSSRTGDAWSFAFKNTKPTTPPPTPDTYGFSFTKVAEGDASKTLAGAVFSLSGNGVSKTATSDAYGRVWFDGLEPGEYAVTETKAPAGYVLPSPAPSFTVTVGDKGAVSFSGFGELVSCDANAAGASCSLLVANKPTTPPPPETPKYP